MISACYRARWAAWFWVALAAHVGVDVADIGEVLVDDLRRRRSS